MGSSQSPSRDTVPLKYANYYELVQKRFFGFVGNEMNKQQELEATNKIIHKKNTEN
jgi:hypothetical protein